MITDDPITNCCRSMVDISIPMISRFNRLMFLLRDLEGNIEYLNVEFELQLTIEDRAETNESEVRNNME